MHNIRSCYLGMRTLYPTFPPGNLLNETLDFSQISKNGEIEPLSSAPEAVFGNTSFF